MGLRLEDLWQEQSRSQQAKSDPITCDQKHRALKKEKILVRGCTVPNPTPFTRRHLAPWARKHLFSRPSPPIQAPGPPYKRKSSYINPKRMAQGGNNPEGIDENNWELLKTLARGVGGRICFRY